MNGQVWSYFVPSLEDWIDFRLVCNFYFMFVDQFSSFKNFVVSGIIIVNIY